MNLLRAALADDGGDTDTAPPAPLTLTESGRLGTDPAAWLRPLPPSLWARLPESDRDAHEQLATRHADAATRARQAAEKARATVASDEDALRAALTDGKAAPKPKRQAAEQQAEQAAHEAAVAAELVVESGGALVRKFSDAELRAAIAEAEAAAREVILDVREQVDGLLDGLRRASEHGGEARWLGTLLERRRQLVWRPVSTPYSARVAQASQFAQETRAYLDAELGEQQHRDAPAPVHHAPGGAPAAGTWTTAGIDPTA